MKAVLDITRRLADEVDALSFGEPVTHVYNPLRYAFETHADYVRRYAGHGQTLLLGMNPGPWGMAQTGVPFGEIAHVRDWMGIQGVIGKPSKEHPKRKVLGFECTRSEVSGRRLWEFGAETFGTPHAFFERFFVVNYCPLSFMEESGRNRIPEKLPAKERNALFNVCDRALRDTVAVLQPRMVVGVGAFAEKRAKAAIGQGYKYGRVLHPSPASPAANRGWAPQAYQQLQALGAL
jgi:single-strand selective monofunctional uracil DNA glycosylase